MTPTNSRDINLDAPQGEAEEHSETYKEYDERAPETSTPRSAKSDSGAASSAGRQAGTVNDSIEEAILYAKKYLEDVLSFFGLNTDVHATSEDDEVVELSIPSTHLNGFLIGARGETLRAFQYLVSTALKNQNYVHTRVNIDVADYKKQRAARLAEQAKEWFEQVRDSGQPKELSPMNAADRRVIHKAAGEYGLISDSVGEGRDRHIVLKPSGQND